MTHFILATAGHVDHGKSALVRALTGTDPDRLPEEKARGITIDLGFAELDLGQGIHAAIIDVPGHEDFVRNMIAGVGSIDLALLVVAADDGWMPQTEEHLEIMTYLGLSRMVAAVTKSDLGGAEEVAAEIRSELSSTRYADAPVVQTSVALGSGFAELKEVIAHELLKLPDRFDLEKPRLPVDRAFSLRGLGTIVTGTLHGGSIQAGRSIVIQPGHVVTRVRSIQTFGQDVETAQPGRRVALNLPDLGIGKTDHEVARGSVVTTLTTDPSSTLDVLVEISARRAKHNSRAQPLKNNSMVDVHHGTSRVPAKLLFLEGDSLAPGAGAFAQLRLSAPLFSFLEDRLVLRDRSQQNTIGGGIVLDPDARRESFRLEAQRAFLKARASKPGDVTIAVKSQIARDKIADVSTLLLKSPFSPASVRAAVHTLQKSGEITLLGDVAVESSTWQTLRERAAEIVDRFHAKDPDLPGLDLNAFHAAFPDLSSALFDSFVQDLCRADFVQKEHFIARREHQTVLPPSLEAVAVKIREMLAANPFDPPTRNRIAPDQSARQALRFLISEGLVTEISPELVLLRTAFDRMTTLIRDFLTKHGTATVSQIREELRTSRRVLVPLLEFLDGQKITRRIGDQRILAD